MIQRYSQQTPQCGEGESTQLLPQKKWHNSNNNNKRDFRLKEIKDMHQSNVLGEPYLDLTQIINCKKAIFEKNQGKRFRIR